MRPAHGTPHDHSRAPLASPAVPPAAPTPLYDALCAEYRRAFRTLPGDRSGEEDLAFRSFGGGPLAPFHGMGPLAGLHSPYAGAGAGWQPYAAPRAPAGHHPAALPPAPRRGV